jgi:hypothetical protein
VLKTKRKLSSTNTHEQVKKKKSKGDECYARGKSDDTRMTDKQKKNGRSIRDDLSIYHHINGLTKETKEEEEKTR